MLGKQPQTICFNGFILDLSRGCVRRGDKEIRLRPKSFDVLQYLVRNQGRLISKQEVIRAVWADAFVTDNSLVQCMIEIRRSLGDAAQTMIRTIPFKLRSVIEGPPWGEITGSTGNPIRSWRHRALTVSAALAYLLEKV